MAHRKHLRSQRASLQLTVMPPAGQYSVQKFLELQDYIRHTSAWRALLSIVVTPLPGLFAALLPAFLPLQPLRYGATPAFFAHVFLVVFFATSGAIMPTLVVTKVPPAVYSLREVVVVALCCSTIHLLVTSPLLLLWRFPIPFFWVLGTCLWLGNAMLAHLLVLRQRCRRPELRTALRHYGLGLLLQVVQVAVYPAISVLFDHVDDNTQIVITLLFPIVKIAMKRALRQVTCKLKDQHGVVVVSAVEICSSLYQSQIMQSAPSRVAMLLVMLIDVVQGLVAIKFFLDRSSSVKQNALMASALAAIRDQQLVSSTDVAKLTVISAASVVPSPGPHMSDAAPLRTQSKRKRASQHVLISQALQVTHVAETVLLVEYFEVVVPLVNCAFLGVAARLRSAFFNTKLRPLHEDPARLRSAVSAILLYSLLQGASCVAMQLVMRYRYGLSAGHHLAFVLARHRVAIQGKMVAWLPVILHFTSAHYGTDFAFRFDFRSWDQW